MTDRTVPLGLGDAARLALAVGGAAAVLFSVALLLEGRWTEATICLTATAALAALILPLALGRRVALYEPIWLILASVALGTTANSFYIAFGPPDPVRFLLLDLTPEDLLYPTLVIAAGTLCLAVGYVAGARWRLPVPARPPAPAGASPAWDRRGLAVVVGALLLIGLASSTVFIVQLDLTIDSPSDLSAKRFVAQGQEGLAVRGYLRWGAQTIRIAFLLVFAHWIASRRRLRWPAAVAVTMLALLALAFPIFVSSRQEALMLVLRVLLLWLCIRGEPRLRWVLVAAALALALFGSMRALRAGAAGWQEASDFVDLPALVEQMVAGRRFLDMTRTSQVVSAVPETIDYQYGKTLVSWLVAPLPRAWWPGKPPIGIGATVGGLVHRAPEGVGVPPGIVAELYLNFGIPGVLVGLFAFGALLRRLFAAFEPHLQSPGAALVYVVVATRLGVDMFPHDISLAMTRLLQELVPLGAALWLCRGRDTDGRLPFGPEQHGG